MYWFDLRQQFGPIGAACSPSPASSQLATHRCASRRADGRALRDQRRLRVQLQRRRRARVLPAVAFHGRAAGRARRWSLAARRTPRAMLPCGGADDRVCRLRGRTATFRRSIAAAIRRPAEVIAASHGRTRRSARHSARRHELAGRRMVCLYFAKINASLQSAHARAPDLLLYAPALVTDNQAAGRAIALTERARSEDRCGIRTVAADRRPTRGSWCHRCPNGVDGSAGRGRLML